MADVKQPAPAPAAKATPAPVQKPAEVPEAKPAKVKKQWKYEFTSSDEAKTEAEGREKGPRKAFKVSANGKDYFIVHVNEGRALGYVAEKLGFTADEIGKSKKAKVVGVDGLKAALEALPPEERAKFLAEYGVK